MLGGTVQEKSINYILLIYFVDIFVEIFLTYNLTLLFNEKLNSAIFEV